MIWIKFLQKKLGTPRSNRRSASYRVPKKRHFFSKVWKPIISIFSIPFHPWQNQQFFQWKIRRRLFLETLLCYCLAHWRTETFRFESKLNNSNQMIWFFIPASIRYPPRVGQKYYPINPFKGTVYVNYTIICYWDQGSGTGC